MHFCMLMFKLKVKFFLVNSYLTLCQNKFSQWHFWSTERKHGTKNYFNIKGKTYIYILIFILSVYRLINDKNTSFSTFYRPSCAMEQNLFSIVDVLRTKKVLLFLMKMIMIPMMIMIMFLKEKEAFSSCFVWA